MPKVDVNLKRGYEASVPVEKIWRKLESGEIDKNFCIPLGEDTKKKDHFIDLDTAYHIIVAGKALSGVGMFRRVTLATLLKFNKPEDLKFILIDPLKISFFYFNNIKKYLIFPIIKENEEALRIFDFALQELEKRYRILMESGSRNIRSYNKKNPDKKIPKIVIIITELGELMDSNKEATEGFIIRISQMAKASGIHLILTTQRPSNEVITPLIKCNIPTRIAFQMSAKEESLLLIDEAGAEKLLGQGDMLVNKMSEEAERMQGYCLEEEAVEEIIFE